MPGISIKTTISEKELPKFKTESHLHGCAITGNNGGTCTSNSRWEELTKSG